MAASVKKPARRQGPRRAHRGVVGARDRQCGLSCDRQAYSRPTHYRREALGSRRQAMTKRKWTISFAACLLSAQALAAGPPTRILVNGNVLTMDASDRMAQALAIEGDKIVAVGSDANVRRLAGPDTSIIDLGGRTVIPGLNDAHIHAIRGGQTFRRETYWYDVASLEDALARVKDAAAKRGAGKWVMLAGSWSPAQFTENRAPTVEDLDRILPDNPGYVQYLYDY